MTWWKTPEAAVETVPVADFESVPAAALQWGVRGEGGSVIECRSRTQADAKLRQHATPFRTVSLVCRLPGDWEPGREWRAATAAPLLERIAALTYERDWAVTELATWTGAL